MTCNLLVVIRVLIRMEDKNSDLNVYVSHPCQIKHKTLFLKIDLNAFSNRGHIYGHFENKNQINRKLTKW